MSLRLKTLATLNVAVWLIAVPLLLASLLSPIVGFNGWQDHVLPGGRRRLGAARRHARARTREQGPAAPSGRDGDGRDAAPAARPPRRPRLRLRLASPQPRRARTCATVRRRAVARRRAAERRRLAARRHAAAREAERPVVAAAPPAAPEPVRVKATKPPKPAKPPKRVAQHAVPASVKVHKLKAPKVKAVKARKVKAPKVKAPKVKPPRPQPAAAPGKPGKGPR